MPLVQAALVREYLHQIVPVSQLASAVWLGSFRIFQWGCTAANADLIHNEEQLSTFKSLYLDPL